MYTKIVLCCLVAVAAAQQINLDGPPQPYSFSYDNTDEFGTRMSQQETGDENNNKVGSYSYVDAAGVTRTVKYTADASGFHAVVETNEPGTKTSSPADAQYVSSALDAAPAQLAAVKPAQVVVQSSPVVHAVQAAPVTLHAAPVSFATAHHVAPVTLSAQPFAISGAPLTYTLTKAKSA